MAAFVLSLLVMSNTYARVTVHHFDEGSRILVTKRPKFESMVRGRGGHAPPKRARR